MKSDVVDNDVVKETLYDVVRMFFKKTVSDKLIKNFHAISTSILYEKQIMMLRLMRLKI